MAETRSRLAWRRLPWPMEVLSIGIGYVLYAAIRVMAPDREGAAYLHAWQVESMQRQLGFFPELSLNGFLSRHDTLTAVASYYYSTLHFIVTPLVLIWVWKCRQRVYAQLRSSLVLASVAALVVYATWPLAPPRFALTGAVDSISQHPVLWDSGHGVKELINELAAMPSLHVGWALWCAAAVVIACGSAWRHLAWLYPLLTTVVVVATANHYVLDAVGGALVVAVPMVLCGLYPARARLLRPRALAPGAAVA